MNNSNSMRLSRPSRRKIAAALRVEVADLPTSSSPRVVARWLAKAIVERYDLNDTCSINRGYCFIWAYLFWALMPPRTCTFVSDSSHVAVKVGDLFFDGANTQGTTDEKRLGIGIFHRPMWKFRVRDLIVYWGWRGLRRIEFRSLLTKLIRLNDNLFRALSLEMDDRMDRFELNTDDTVGDENLYEEYS